MKIRIFVIILHSAGAGMCFIHLMNAIFMGPYSSCFYYGLFLAAFFNVFLCVGAVKRLLQEVSE